MSTQQQIIASAELYADLMEEVKLRIAAIDYCTLNQSGLAPQFVKEFSFLQLRLVCELIALGCLVAHGDIKQSKKLKKEWAADKIIQELEKLHPNFFPRAVVLSPAKNGIRDLRTIPGHLTKEQLIEMYHECGGVLHKGNVKKLLKRNAPAQIHYPDITAKAQAILDLLNKHIVLMAGFQRHFLCILRNYKNDFKAQVGVCDVVEKPAQPVK